MSVKQALQRTLVLAAMAASTLFSLPEAQAQEAFKVYAAREAVSFERMMEQLGKADVVFVGENHDHAQGHALELALLRGMYERNPRLALSLEMFERDVQPVLDEYLGGYITETHLLQSARPWPNYKTDYRPMVEFCRENKLPVIAANAPRRYVNIVSRKGQDGLRDLPKAAQDWLPKLPYAMELPPGYDRMLSEIFGDTHGASTGATVTANMPSAAHMKEAQGLWDSTMADSIMRGLKTYRGRQVMQVNGAGHSDSGWGIVARLRQANPRLKVMIVTIRPDAAYPTLSDKYDGVADFVILTPPAPAGK